MSVGGCGCKPRMRYVAIPQVSTLASTKLQAAKHWSRAPNKVNRHKTHASPWSPTPYQWAPLPQSGQDLTDGVLERKDFGKFVQFFRQASPYIEGHRGRTFVVVIPGEVSLEVGVHGPRNNMLTCMRYTYSPFCRSYFSVTYCNHCSKTYSCCMVSK